MRLINVDSLEIESFFNVEVPRYSILSHTWGAEEVTFQEWQSDHQAIAHKAGYQKIIGACKTSKEHGIDYLWCDTNCINKLSSAELDEAINSMFAWYRDSEVCYAYLADVDPFDTSGLSSSGHSAFRSSRWFTRGWTLQELLAPSTVQFYSNDWAFIGTSHQLSRLICEAAHIDESVFTEKRPLKSYSIAQRMSWASSRTTTRIEDEAYCLLGIFDTNIPLVYGEGRNAFRRLQQEIMKNNTDASLLVWTLPNQGEFHREGWAPILAPSVAAFKHSGSIISTKQLPGPSLSGGGISISLQLLRSSVSRLYYGLLPCSDLNLPDDKRNEASIWIPLCLPKENPFAEIPCLYRPSLSTDWMCFPLSDVSPQAKASARAMKKTQITVVENRYNDFFDTSDFSFSRGLEGIPAPDRAAIMLLTHHDPDTMQLNDYYVGDKFSQNPWTCGSRFNQSIVHYNDMFADAGSSAESSFFGQEKRGRHEKSDRDEDNDCGEMDVARRDRERHPYEERFTYPVYFQPGDNSPATTFLLRFNIYYQKRSPYHARGELIETKGNTKVFDLPPKEETDIPVKAAKPIEVLPRNVSDNGEQRDDIVYLQQRKLTSARRPCWSRLRDFISRKMNGRAKASRPLAWMGERSSFLKCNFGASDERNADGSVPQRWYIPVILEWVPGK